MDDNSSGDLTFNEFKNGVHDLGLIVSDEEYQQLFQLFDRDGSGTVKYDEFLRSIRVCCVSIFVQHLFNICYYCPFVTVATNEQDAIGPGR